MRKYLLSPDGNFYKANLHCHTNISDGRLSPEEVKELYVSRGYSVVAYTDHDLFIPHHELTDEKFLALSGFEAEFNSAYPGKKFMQVCHLCFIAKSPDTVVMPCWNPDYAYIGNSKQHLGKIKFDPKTMGFVRKHTPENISAMIAECKKAGFFVTYNHPAWSMENYEQYTRYEGLDAMEILNYSCERLGYPAYADLIYDDMLRANGKLFAIAADDNHDKYPPDSPYSDACGGYVMIKAKSLDYETVINALCAGDFYASGGPSIYELYLEDGRVHVSCSDAARITLNAGHRATKTVIAPDNATVNGAVFDYKEDDLYLRITVKDREGKCAFSNAYFL